jgi:hypothetical protein
MAGWLVNNELERMWKEDAAVAYFRHYQRISLRTSGVRSEFEPWIRKKETGVLLTRY